MLRALAIGWRAYAALGASGGVVRVTAPLSRSVYGEAAGELVWVGPRDAALHPRAVLVEMVPGAVAATHLHLRTDGVVGWRPPRSAPRTPSAATASRVSAALVDGGEPLGLARVLAAGNDDAVVRYARPLVDALARASAANDAAAFAQAARPLLGLGAGLTPSGDDLVGGALFARRLLLGPDAAWDEAVARISEAAARLTHPISAQLLADLAAGDGWAPLHELLAALASDDVARAVTGGRRVTALGHTSGWDLLGGVLIAAAAASVAPETAGTTS